MSQRSSVALILGLVLSEAYSPGGANFRSTRLLRAQRTLAVRNDLSILGAEDADSACVLLPQCRTGSNPRLAGLLPLPLIRPHLCLTQHSLRRRGAIAGVRRD